MKKIKLGDCATFINGYAFKPSDWKKTGTQIVRIQDLTGSIQNPNFYDGNLDEKYMIDNGDILISWSGSLGIYEWNKEKAYLNQHIFKVKFDKIEFNKRYFVYLVKSKISEMLKNVHGSTMKHITKKKFEKIQIELHSLERQQEIAQKLDIIQEIIDIRKKQIEELDEIIKSQFVEMFETEKRYVHLEDVCIFINGDRGKNYPSANKISKNSNGVPFINAGLLTNNTVDWENMNYISEETYNKLGAGKIQKYDILYCLRGSLGKHAIIDFDNKGAIASSLVILRANRNKIQPNFLMIQLGMDEIIRQQNQANNGSSQPNLSASSVKKYKIKLPDIGMQNKFVNIVKQIDKQKFEIQKNLEEMQKLQESLMNKYFG